MISINIKDVRKAFYAFRSIGLSYKNPDSCDFIDIDYLHGKICMTGVNKSLNLQLSVWMIPVVRFDEEHKDKDSFGINASLYNIREYISKANSTIDITPDIRQDNVLIDLDFPVHVEFKKYDYHISCLSNSLFNKIYNPWISFYYKCHAPSSFFREAIRDMLNSRKGDSDYISITTTDDLLGKLVWDRGSRYFRLTVWDSEKKPNKNVKILIYKGFVEFLRKHFFGRNEDHAHFYVGNGDDGSDIIHIAFKEKKLFAYLNKDGVAEKISLSVNEC